MPAWAAVIPLGVLVALGAAAFATDLICDAARIRRLLRPKLFVTFSPKGTHNMQVQQILTNDPNGVDLTLLETAKGAPVPLSKGPFTVDVADPNGCVTIVPGSADQTTPTSLVANGSGNTGAVTVTVTDTSNGLVTPPTVLQVVAPPPPAPDAIEVAFTARTTPLTAAS